MKTKFRHTYIFSLVVLILSICSSNSINAQIDNERIYVKIEIKGMACPFCAFGMEKELKKVSGVDNVEIELESGLAYISTPVKQKPTTESLEKIIIDAGFTVGRIEYSSKPFALKEPKE